MILNPHQYSQLVCGPHEYVPRFSKDESCWIADTETHNQYLFMEADKALESEKEFRRQGWGMLGGGELAELMYKTQGMRELIDYPKGTRVLCFKRLAKC